MKLSTGQRIAGGASILLFLFMLLLPWYGTKHVYTDNGILLPARYVTVNAWRSFQFIDIVLTLAILTVAFSIFRTAGRPRSRALRATARVAVAAAGTQVTILVAYRNFVPLNVVERHCGLWLGLLAARGMLAGGVRWMDEEGAAVGGVKVADVRQRLSEGWRRVQQARRR
jgi:hypothetical protein